MQPFRFLLYCVSAVVGVFGLINGGCPVIAYFWENGLFPRGDIFDNNQLFQNMVIFFLSLILLILIHIGHRVAGAFDVSSPKKPEASESPKHPEA
jgi:hypothetical protein